MSKYQECPDIMFFGGYYPDARCIDGYLYDLDNCDENGNLYDYPNEQIPCPFCNKELFIERCGEDMYEAIKSWVERFCPEYEFE